MDFCKKVEDFLDDRKNANCAVDLLNYLKERKHKVKHRVMCLVSVQLLFDEVFKRGYFFIDPNLKITNIKAFEVEEQYVKWLSRVYESTFQYIVKLLNSTDKRLQSQALSSLLSLLAAETKRSNLFPFEKFQIIMSEVFYNDLVPLYVPFLKHRDTLFYTWKFLKEFLTSTQDESDAFTVKVLVLMSHMVPENNDEVAELLFHNDQESFVYKEELVRKWMQKVWLTLTNRRINATNHKKLLMLLLEKYLSVLYKPTLLTDFLVGSLAGGGPAGLLALQGMSVLVTKHNLECPDIFGKLYNMFQQDLFHTRYKARLFHLADLFLRSTYLSEQLVAAFAKRLSRLALVAQACDLVLIMQFVGNLLIRHPALSVLIHNPVPQSVEKDPFDMNEQDPVKSRALESSLWELALLKKHVQPKVSAAAKFLDANLPSVEWDFREHLETTYPQMFESETKKDSKKEPPLTFVRPTTLEQLRDDRLYKMWSLT